jgi:hypothetical protein
MNFLCVFWSEIDGKKKTQESKRWKQLHERRKQVVRLHKKGIKIMQIVEMTGLSYPPVRATIDLFEAGGWGAIRPALRGAQPRGWPCAQPSARRDDSADDY